MMDIRTYRSGAVIFRQGDDGDCMYDIQQGKVGIYYDYGGPNEKLLAELMPDQIFGEMGLLDGGPRSATAVALVNDTVLYVITEAEFESYYKEHPSKVLLVMQQMCSRLRRTTKNYIEACRTMTETVETEKKGAEKSSSLKSRIKRFCDLYTGFNYYAH